MDDWERFNETLLLGREDFCSHLNMEEITDANYTHPKRICKDFRIKILGKYLDLYVQSYPLLLTDIFKKFQNMCPEIHELHPEIFLPAALKVDLKMTKVILDILTGIDMLLMLEKSIRGGIFHGIY